MSLVRRIVAFWYDFIVGDDWTVAAGVLALLALTGILARLSTEAWAWVVVPLGTMLLLAASLVRATRA